MLKIDLENKKLISTSMRGGEFVFDEYINQTNDFYVVEKDGLKWIAYRKNIYPGINYIVVSEDGSRTDVLTMGEGYILPKGTKISLKKVIDAPEDIVELVDGMDVELEDSKRGLKLNVRTASVTDFPDKVYNIEDADSFPFFMTRVDNVTDVESFVAIPSNMYITKIEDITHRDTNMIFDMMNEDNFVSEEYIEKIQDLFHSPEHLQCNFSKLDTATLDLNDYIYVQFDILTPELFYNLNTLYIMYKNNTYIRALI